MPENPVDLLISTPGVLSKMLSNSKLNDLLSLSLFSFLSDSLHFFTLFTDELFYINQLQGKL